MKPFKKVLVGLNGTERDNTVIKNIATMSQFMAIDKIFFLHCESIPFLPKGLLKKYQEVETKTSGNLSDLLTKTIVDNFPDISKYNYDLVIKSGDRSECLINFVTENDIDFLALGREQFPGISYQTRKIGHLATCSIGLFPLIPKDKFRKIVVPVDFSDISIRGLDRAYFYQKNNPEIDVIPVHFYEVPVGYYKIGKSYQEFNDIIRFNAKTSFEKSFEKLEFKPNTPTFDLLNIKGGSVTNRIFNYTLLKDADLIIMGSRGRTSFASFMLGSVAVKLMELIYHIPLIIEKDKQKNLGLSEIYMQ